MPIPAPKAALKGMHCLLGISSNIVADLKVNYNIYETGISEPKGMHSLYTVEHAVLLRYIQYEKKPLSSAAENPTLFSILPGKVLALTQLSIGVCLSL